MAAPLPCRCATTSWALAALALLLGGCLTRQRVRHDLRREREAAFQAWRRARAGQPSTRETLRGELSPTDAQLVALGSNKQLQAMLEEKRVADGRIAEAWSGALPKVELTASYRRQDEVPSFGLSDFADRGGGQAEGAESPGAAPTEGAPTGAEGAAPAAAPSGEDGAGRISIGDVHSYSLNATLRQPIYRGGAVAAGIRAAVVYDLLADEKVRGVVQDVLFQTRDRYIHVLLARELVEVSEADLARVRRHLADVQKKRDHGVATPFDVLRARVEVSNVEAELIERQNALNLARTSLLKTLGVSQDSTVELTGQLVHQPVEPGLEEAVAAAFGDRPALLQAELGIRLQREAVRAARAGWWPAVDAYFSQVYAKPDPHSASTIAWNDAWNAGVMLVWPLFDGFRTAARVEQEEAKLRRRQIELLEAEETVLLEIRQALLSIEDAEKFVRSQSANLERAREGLRLAEAGYREGVTTEVEVLDARQALSRTQALYYRAIHQHMRARLLLERATASLRPPGKGAEE
ncbi:MAG: TolC family protein [Candidatus Brocadiia bacterium]